jgi:hypothetical protein
MNLKEEKGKEARDLQNDIHQTKWSLQRMRVIEH